MAITIPITIQNNARAAEIAESVCSKYGYQALIDGQPNPQTKVQFVKQVIHEFLLGVHKEIKLANAVQGVESTVETEVDNIVIT